MDRLYDSKIFHLLLLFTVAGELLVPWLLKRFYKGYDSRRMAISVLGSSESPVKVWYNLWLLWTGLFLLTTALTLFSRVRPLAGLTSLCIAVFAVGACILAGIFHVNESRDTVTLASKIHGAGSAIGFLVFLFFPLLRCIAAFGSGDVPQGVVCGVAFVLVLVAFVFFILGDKERFAGTVFSYEGLWERVTLFFLYVPFFWMALYNLTRR